MSPRLGAAVSEPTPKSTPKAKNVDRTAPGESLRRAVAQDRWRASWLRPVSASAITAKAGFLGSRERRTALWADVLRSAIERGHELAEQHNARAHRALVSTWTEAERQAADAARQAEELAELDAEEAGRPGPLGFIPPRAADIAAEERDHTAVARFLPPELSPYLTRMHPARRREREQAIFAYVGWDGLELLGLGPALLAEKAAERARRYAYEYPRRDDGGKPINQEPVHQKGRCEKWQRRRLVKKQTRALLYVEQALGAVGGPDMPGRPLYVSDYALTLHREQLRRTAEILEGLRLILVDDPTVQIPMAELNAKAKVADVTKRRLLIDALLRRFVDLGWHVCWITITLPGRYVANATNEGNRAEAWNPALGPQEALDALQGMHHQTMALLRERNVRPCGWWNAQPQQSGTPHRHIVVACRTPDDARAVCDAFWQRFSSTPIEERQEVRKRADPGCSAYVIGDNDPRYAPPRGKDGKKETAASIARYAARYSTRCEAAPSASAGAEHAAGQDTQHEQQGDEQERFAAWKTRRRVRGHTWIGLDTARSPMETWDTLWANAMRTEDLPDDPRMALAIRLMRETQAHAENAADLRRSAAAMGFGKDRDNELTTAEEESDRAAFLAWHAAIAMGLWPDTDLDPTELDWLRNETMSRDALPPMPLRVTRETAYGEERNTVIGCVAPERRFTLAGRASVETLLPIAERLGVAVQAPEDDSKLRARHVLTALKDAGFGLWRRPDGSRAGFELSGEVLLRTEKEWKIVDTATASEMVAKAAAATKLAQFEQQEEAERRADAQAMRISDAASSRLAASLATVGTPPCGAERLDHLSDSPTDPRNGAPPRPGSEMQGDDPPPGNPGSQPMPNC